MHMIINNQSMVPIYEQIMEQIKKAIASGELSEGSMLPSVRGLAAELRISALTVKKAYGQTGGRRAYRHCAWQGHLCDRNGTGACEGTAAYDGGAGTAEGSGERRCAAD